MPDQENKSADTSKTAPASPQKGSNTKLVIIIVLIAAVLAVLGGGAFFANRFLTERAAETTIEKATGGKVDVEEGGDKVTVETDKGKLTIGQDEIPDSFPSDITVYSGAEVTATTEVADTVSVTLKTSDSISTVSEFYKSDLAKNGWTETATGTFSGIATIGAEKGDKELAITITTDSEDGKTVIAIAVTTSSN